MIPEVMVALNADVVGYSRLMADDFASTTATMAEYHDLVENKVATGDGVLANFVGDSFMAVFAHAEDAIRTAIAITSEIEAANRDVPEQRRARFRMGIDQGDVGVSDGHYHGDALNIAARIQAIAAPGGVSVSAKVYRALDEPALRFRPIGRQALKNIPEHIVVYEFVDLPSDHAPTTERTSLALEAPTIAVLPIHTEMVDSAVRAAAGVIRMDLLHRLAAVPQLNVIDAKTEPGGEHGGVSARYMVDSGAHQVGDQVRVYAMVFDVTTMNVVKSYKWTAPTDEILARSEELADEVARAVEVDLVVGEPAGLYAELDDPEAIENVYLGWYHLRTGTEEALAHAIDLFGEVTKSHPDQPFGYTLSAFANWTGAANDWGPDPDEALRMAHGQAQIANEIGDPTGMAKAVEAAVLMSQGKPDEALAAMDQLEIIRPTCDVTYGLEGSVRRYLGQWERAVDLLDTAMRLTGINKPWYPTVKACSLYVGGQAEDAASLAESVLEYQPNNLEALLVLAAAQTELGLDRRAHATVDLIRERFPSVDVEAWIDKSPYQKQEIVDRWKGDLASAGAIEIA